MTEVLGRTVLGTLVLLITALAFVVGHMLLNEFWGLMTAMWLIVALVFIAYVIGCVVDRVI